MDIIAKALLRDIRELYPEYNKSSFYSKKEQDGISLY